MSNPCASDHVVALGMLSWILKYLADLWNGIVPVACIEFGPSVADVAETFSLCNKVPVAAVVSTIGLQDVIKALFCGANSDSPVCKVAAKFEPLNVPIKWELSKTLNDGSPPL